MARSLGGREPSRRLLIAVRTGQSRLGLLACLGAAILIAACASGTDKSSAGISLSSPTPAELVGQTIVVRMPGRRPTSGLLDRIRAGQIGGVVLFSENYGAAGPARLIATLQEAARAGGRPPLLIAIDQEGGLVKRLPGPPSLAPAQMRTVGVARAQGLATGSSLGALGVNTDLAPVLDVGHGGFITPRTFGSSPGQVAARGVAFAAGLANAGVFATGKHFPGLGYAPTTTDTSQTVVTASRARLEADLLPFRKAIAAGIPMIMVSTASYPRLGSSLPAACSAAIVGSLLRRQLGFTGVAMTDALDTPAVHTRFTTGAAAVAAIRSGIDLVLAVGTTSGGSETDWRETYRALLAALRDGELPRQTLVRAYARIVQLKADIALH